MKHRDIVLKTVVINKDINAMFEKVAKAMNSVGWCGKDNTVDTVIEEFLINCQNESFFEYVANAVDTNTMSAKTDRKRREDLYKAFQEEMG